MSEQNQVLFWRFSPRYGFQNIARAGQRYTTREVACDFKLRTRRMQHETMTFIDRPPAQHRHFRNSRLSTCYGELCEYAAEVHPQFLIDDNAKCAVLTVIEYVDKRITKIGVLHLRHGNQEMMR